MMQKMIHEVFGEVSRLKDNNQKIAVLRQNNSPAMREVLRYALHPNCKFFTSEAPAWNADEAPEGLSYSTLFSEYRRLYIFLDPLIERRVVGKVTTIPKKKELLIAMLESIHPGESRILVSMLNGSFIKTTTITPKLVEEAFPGLLK